MSTHNLHHFGLDSIVGRPIGLPPFAPHTTHLVPVRDGGGAPPPSIPGEGLLRAVNYLADYGGCSFYRCMAPNLMLNLQQKAVIIELTTMILDPRFYQGIGAIKLQRQATLQQQEFVKLLKKVSEQEKFKLIYEIDDIVFREDIPDYNRNKEAFTSDEIRGSIQDIMEMMDEITVTCDYMRDYFKSKLKNQNITVIPNYLLRWWFDRYYSIDKLTKQFEKNKRKKHIISIFASGTHVDVMNKVNQQDDFAPVLSAIIKNRKNYQWQFYGCYPLPLKPFIDNGDIKYVPWVDLPKFPETMANSGTELVFASLQDNNFNRSKSAIKLVEAGALGIPCICPDMCTYKDAFLKYKTGDEFIDQIKYALKDQTQYIRLCKQSRAYADKFWLEDEPNLMKHYEAYFTPYGSKERKYIGR